MAPRFDDDTPLATQFEEVGQEIPRSSLMPLGTDWFLHVDPPLVVDVTYPAGDVVPPTATQSEVVGHETPFRPSPPTS
jgi:hypothetical protein